MTLLLRPGDELLLKFRVLQLWIAMANFTSRYLVEETQNVELAHESDRVLRLPTTEYLDELIAAWLWVSLLHEGLPGSRVTDGFEHRRVHRKVEAASEPDRPEDG